MEEKANIPVNKYSVYDLKNACDTRIIEFLENKKFTEIHTYSNIKILLGSFCLIWTALAYLNGKQLPESYNIILLSLVFYFSGSLIYWYVEKYIIKSIFYVGSNTEYFRSLGNNSINKIKISSEVKDLSNIYSIWVTIVKNSKETESEKIEKSFCELFDERGYCHRQKVNEFIEQVLAKSIASFKDK